MLKIPGPTCGVRLGHDWVDPGTSPVTRMPSAYETATGPLRRQPAPTLSPTEQRLLVALDFAGIANRNERAMFLAQVSVESNGFRRLHENLAYSPERLLHVFHKGGYVKDLADAQALVKGGRDAIAGRVYGPTHKGLGNRDADDGARYVGRGYIQLTGRANYRAAGAALGLDLLERPELVEEPGVATRVAVWYWLQRVSRSAAQIGDVRRVTHDVNGGAEGLKERRRLYGHYLQLLPEPPPVHDGDLRSRTAPRQDMSPYLLLP